MRKSAAVPRGAAAEHGRAPTLSPGDKLLADDLAAGRLVRPFDPSLSTPLTFSYYLLSAKDGAELPKVAAFRDWLLEEARATREG